MVALQCFINIIPKLPGTGRITIVVVLVSCIALPLAKLSLIRTDSCVPSQFPALILPLLFLYLSQHNSSFLSATYLELGRALGGSLGPRQWMSKLAGLRWQDLGRREKRILAVTMGRSPRRARVPPSKVS